MSISRLNIVVFIFYSYSFAICEDKGIKFYNNNQFDKAREYYEKILLEREEDAIASFGLGSTAFQQNDFSLAMKGFESALNTDNIKLRSNAYYNMANILAENKRLEESLAFYRESLVLNPNDLDSKINYELVKFRLQEQQNNKDQESNKEKDNNQDQSNNQNQNTESNQNNEDQDSKENDQADSSNNNNERENKDKENKNNKQEKQKDDEKLSDNEKQEKPIPQDKQNATAILDAIKNNEKINKKIQISKSKRRKLEKDW
ncbi:MAG: tetratricopeptide repeat protein [Candidatus Marinimicrobia bacterium]|nr:tetratricopeptide repeat protein [Candidatus Neomarinimicrobiota bacterium]